MPKRACLDATCGQFATYRGYCQRHARQRDKQINRAGRGIYQTKRWRVLRRRKLNRNPICERCRSQLAVDVHHKHGVKLDPWSIEGLESLCKVCHGKETRQAQVAG